MRMAFWILNLLGHKVHPKSKVGFSLLWINNELVLNEASLIGDFNLILIDNLAIDRNGRIGDRNKLLGPYDFILGKAAAIGNGNSCYRAPLGVTQGKAILRLGELSKITSFHRIDCTCTITMGDYCTLAGHESQLWTHSYYHDRTGPGRFRLDGPIEIGNNVNIGSRSVITCGVRIADGITIGANSSISKSLLKAGVYVNQPLRFIEADVDSRFKFKRVVVELCEEVYERFEE